MPRRRQMTIKLFLTVAAILVIFCTFVYYVTSGYFKGAAFSLTYPQFRTLALELFFTILFFFLIHIFEEEALDTRRHILLGRRPIERSIWVKAAPGQIKNMAEVDGVIDDFLLLLEKAFSAARSRFEPDDTAEGTLQLGGSWFWGDPCLEKFRGGLEKYVRESFGKEMLPQLRDRLELSGRRTLGSILNDLLRFAEHKLHYDTDMKKLGEIRRRIKLKKPLSSGGPDE